VGLGNVGSSTLGILAHNADQVAPEAWFPAQGDGRLQPPGTKKNRARRIVLYIPAIDAILFVSVLILW